MNQQKPHNDFVISIAGTNIDISIINIEEMTGYCSGRNRFANVITEKKSYDELDRTNYSLIMNYTKPKPRVVSTKNKQYLQVYNVISEKYKGGLLIAESDTLSDPIVDLLCKSDNWHKNDVDIMVCREGFSSVSQDEFARADFLRISADPAIDPSIFLKLGDFFQEKTMSLMISQLFANEQYENINNYVNTQNDHYRQQGMTEYIDYHALNKQLAYFIYYDVKQNKILNVDKQVIIEFVKRMSKEGALPIPETHIVPYCDDICL